MAILKETFYSDLVSALDPSVSTTSPTKILVFTLAVYEDFSAHNVQFLLKYVQCNDINKATFKNKAMFSD